MFISKNKIATFADFCRLRHEGLYFGNFEWAYSDRNGWPYPDFRAWWDENEKKIVGHYVVGFAFTDYGGDFWDFCCCQVAKKIAENGGLAMHEKTSYNGENGIVLGERADEIVNCRGELYDMWRVLTDDVKGWNDTNLDDYMTKVEEERRNKEVWTDGVLDSDLLLSDDEKEFALDWLQNNARVTATGLDYVYRELVDSIRKMRNGGAK